MTKNPHLLSLFGLMLMFLPYGASAQGGGQVIPKLEAKTMDQYPSFIEVTGSANGIGQGSEFDLRCGINYDSGGYVLNGFTDITFVNQSEKAYARHQNINGKLVVAVFAPESGNQRMLVEIVEPDGSVRAKNCQLNLQNDALQDCQPAAVFMPFEQANVWPSVAAQACQIAVTQKASEMSKVPPKPEDIVEFQRQLAQKITILEK